MCDPGPKPAPGVALTVVVVVILNFWRKKREKMECKDVVLSHSPWGLGAMGNGGGWGGKGNGAEHGERH